MLNIFYIGKFELSYRTENYVAHALTTLGCNVKKRHITNSMTLEGIKRQIIDNEADLVLFSKSRVEWFTELIRWCRQRGIITVCWIFDLMWGIPRSGTYKDLSQYRVDYLFTTDGGNGDKWRSVGANHITLRQGVHLPEHIAYPSENPRYDVGFVGTDYKHGNRSHLLRWLKGYYQHKFIHHTKTRGLKLNQALANVKIIIGDSYPSPNYWSNRVYEIIGRGGLLFHPDTVGLDTEVTHREHYVRYKRIAAKSDFIILAKQINAYLKTPELCARIRLQGFQHIGKHHTYIHRCLGMLRHINEIPPLHTTPSGSVAPATGIGVRGV